MPGLPSRHSRPERSKASTRAAPAADPLGDLAAARADIDALKAQLAGTTGEAAAAKPKKIAAASPQRGRAVFARSCASCHVLFDAGAHIGPELTGSNRADLDYVLANVVDPNAFIGKDYLLTTVETKDGRTAAGILQRETPATVTIVNPAETLTLARENLKAINRHEVSLMPPGLLAGLKETDVADLIAYLRSPTQVAP